MDGIIRRYENQVVTEDRDGMITWRSYIYKKTQRAIDQEFEYEIYENIIKNKESKVKKLTITIWILCGVIVTLINILLSTLI